MYLAHRTEDGRTQSILEHARQVAELCAAFAAPFGADELGKQLGLAHDIGKYSSAFQRRILGENIKTDHSTAGAKEICKHLGLPAAYCVAGHHGGLPDGGGKMDAASDTSLNGRLKRPVEPYESFSREIHLERVAYRPPKVMGTGGFTMAFWIRMLFSCLVDADYLDTETFMRGVQPRGSDSTMEQLFARLKAYIADWQNPESDLNRARCDILRACLNAGEEQAPGLFTLTVPTGGGKTISSLAFALRHAIAYGKKRIVYVIPYTGIIEQTADTFRKVLGEDVVLEHHSNVDFGDDESSPRDPEKERKKLAAENWDLPVVVTTAVQFFESLFSNRPSRCRKLHNLVDSVVIFDEAQTIPLPYLQPCVRAIAELTVNYGATCVLCTATQPAPAPLFQAISSDLIAREIAPPIPSRVFHRVRYEHLGRLSDEALAQRLRTHKQVLCIVSTRRQAQAVYGLLNGEHCFHLSTLMPPERRRAILKTIKERLKMDLPCRVISTSLIEAGVDIDFPTVYRSEAGLDSLVQAAGRCNREGKYPAENSVVYIFRPDDVYTDTLPHSMKRPLEVMRSVVRDDPDLDAPKTIEDYFTALRQFTGEAIDSMHIVSMFESGVRDPWNPSFPFAKAAEKFHLIDRNTYAVLIPYTERAKDLAARLNRGERSRALLREAGQYSVNIYAPHFNALKDRGALELPEEDLAVLTDMSLYSEDTGLALSADSGVGIFL